MPYWDWAEDATVPPFAGDEELTVLGTDGPETIANPLFSYHFPQAAINGDYGRIILGDRDTTKTIRCSPSEANERLAEIDLKGMVVSIGLNRGSPAVPSGCRGVTMERTC